MASAIGDSGERIRLSACGIAGKNIAFGALGGRFRVRGANQGGQPWVIGKLAVPRALSPYFLR